MDTVRRLLDQLLESVFPYRASEHGSHPPSFFSRLAMPHSFNPKLRPLEAWAGACGCLIRIFGTCVWLAIWGGAGAAVWNAIGSRLWRGVALVPLLLLFPAGLLALFVAIRTMEKVVWSKRL